MRDYKSDLQKVFEGFDLPSMSVAIYDHGEVEYFSFGQADIQNGLVPDEKTRYMIGSTSKSFIAAAVAKLAAEGKLDLDEKIKTYIKDYSFYNDEMNDNITVRMILSHQTGLPRHDVSWVNNVTTTLEQQVYNVKYLQPAFKVSERFHYQNHMYALASYLVEKISGMPWQDYVQENFLNPLNMDRTLTHTGDFGQAGDNCAKPYAKMQGKNVPWKIWPSDNMGCAASITSTAEDCLKWAVCHLKNGVYNGQEIIPASAEKEIKSPQMPIKEFEMYSYDTSKVGIEESAYGFGWFIDKYKGHKCINHGGTVGGFRTACGYIEDEDVAYVVYANLDNTAAVTAAQYAIYDVAFGYEKQDWTSIMKACLEEGRARSGKMLKPLLESVNGEFDDKSVIGEYQHPAYGTVKITEIEGKVRIWFLGVPLAIKSAANGMLIIDALDLAGIAAPCKFVYDDKKNVVAIAIVLEPTLPNDPIIYSRIA